MTSTQSYAAVADHARDTTEKSVDVWKKGASSFADQTDIIFRLPIVDLSQPLARYFEYVQKSIDLSGELATNWADLLTSLSDALREQAEQVGQIVLDQTAQLVDLAARQPEKAEQVFREQAEKAELAVREQAEVEQAKKEQARQVKQAEREQAKQADREQAKEKARAPYEGLTKAELSDKLAERDLPKTGTVEELIERLVRADSK